MRLSAWWFHRHRVPKNVDDERGVDIDQHEVAADEPVRQLVG